MGIPISFLGAIWLMPMFDVSINMMSLFAFILVLGIVVDDAIVVSENIHTHQERHGQGLKGAIYGAQEISTPIIFAVMTTMAAFLAAPFTSLTPVIGAGYVAAGVQAWVHPPLVQEFHSVGDDIANLGAWWRSRLLRVFLVFILTTLGSLLGTWVGGYEIVSNLF